MKVHPTRNKSAGKTLLRGRIMTAVFSSANGKRVIRECQEALNMPVNSDEESRRLVLSRYADEVDITPFELEDLLKWK